MSDIKATVDELERLELVAEPVSWSDHNRAKHLPANPHWLESASPTDRAFVVAARNAMPSLLAELRRLWAKEARQDAIEEAAVRYREASEAYQELKLSADMAAVNYAHRRNAEAREDLFAALPPRKPSGGEEESK